MRLRDEHYPSVSVVVEDCAPRVKSRDFHPTSEGIVYTCLDCRASVENAGPNVGLECCDGALHRFHASTVSIVSVLTLDP